MDDGVELQRSAGLVGLRGISRDMLRTLGATIRVTTSTSTDRVPSMAGNTHDPIRSPASAETR